MDAPLSKIALSTAARTRHWLLHGPAQLRSGAHRGGIAGWIDRNGQPHYVYAEVTGYYLHWLAQTTPGDDLPVRRAGAHTALAWCERSFGADTLPATRVYLLPAEADWRNQAVFFFDLAMLLRGVCACVEAKLIAAPQDLLARLIAELAAFVRDGSLHAVRVLNATAELPERWSTRADRFLVKAAIRVLAAQSIVALPASLHDACMQLCARHLAGIASAAITELHATLYYLEGALLAGRQHWNDIAMLLARLLALQLPSGELPEAPATPVLRSDVLAQALRIGVLLRQYKVVGAPGDARLHRLASALCARVLDGAITFRTDAPAPQFNVWCALFAEQALRWYGDWQSGAARRADPAALV